MLNIKKDFHLKGLKGANLFISKGFELSQGMANLGTFSAELEILDIQKVIPTNITVRYDLKMRSGMLLMR